MQAITDIGQAEIRAGGRRIFLNPSFLAMSRIGTPEEIVTAFVTVHGGHYPEHRISDAEVMRSIQARCFADMVVTAAKVVQASGDDEHPERIGARAVTEKGNLPFRHGLLSVSQIIHVGGSLIRRETGGGQGRRAAGK